MSTIIFSGDDGDTFTVSNVTGDTALPLDLIRAGDFGPFFALRDHASVGATGSIRRSVDGQEWEEFIDPLHAGGIDDSPASLAYDFKADSLYIAYQTETYIFALQKASQVDSGQCNDATLEAGADILTNGVAHYWQVLPRVGFAQRGFRALIVNKKAHP